MLLVLCACAEPLDDVPEVSEACVVDTDCASGLCARTGECLSKDDLRKAQVIWTDFGQPPDAQSCYWSPTVTVEFWENDFIHPGGKAWRSAPVPCTLGKFTVDRLPMRFWIGGVQKGSAGRWVPLDASGVAHIDFY
jgi:hypothetical protein